MLTENEKQAVDYGIDLNLIELNLTLTPQERFDRLQSMLNLLEELRRHFIPCHGQSEKTPTASRQRPD
jgi:hypothetical protein